MSRLILIFVLASCHLIQSARAGIFAPLAGQPGSTAIDRNDASLVAWATGYTNYQVGADCIAAWQTPNEALGVAGGSTNAIVCLGRSGQITMTFEEWIIDGPGADFAIFENAFSYGATASFLELAYVEVSQDGINFLRFDCVSLTQHPMPTYAGTRSVDVTGFASKYRIESGTPFDLNDLGINYITHVRLVDIAGDGASLDSFGNIIYDPYPGAQSAGFDLNAIGVIHQLPSFQAWQNAYFTPTESADPHIGGSLANPENDSFANLLEYAFDLHPRLSDGSSILVSSVATGFLDITFPRSTSKPDINYIVESGSDLSGWTTIARSDAGGITQPVNGLATVSESGVSGTIFVTVTDQHSITTSTRRFIRVRVVKP